MDDGGDTGQDDDDERATELHSVSAIYPEIVVDPKSPYAASLDLAVTPLTPVKIRFKPSADGNAPQLPTPRTSTEQVDSLATRLQTLPSETAVDEHDLAHLPSLIIHITLPEQYPANAPPTVQLSCIPAWIPQTTLNTLEDDCEKLWEEWGRAEVVYTYIDHLSQAAENAFGVGAQGFQLSSDMKLVLLDFDLKTKRELFDKETFDCGICLEPKKGSICHRLMLCGHVFCVTCLQDFYNNCITEGDVDNVKCLDPGCKGIGTAGPATPKRRKQDRTINPSELLQIPIEQELVQRYVRMKRKRKLEADKNTIYCPRQWCQGAARSKKHPKPVDLMNDLTDSASDSEAEAVGEPSATPKKKEPEYVPMSERLSICEDCSFAFCSVCKKGWHGEMDVCNPRRDNEMNEEEKASLAYLQRYSTPCPTCSAPAQKTMGCNHMICHVCKTHYCYLCSAYLMPDNPYRHYNEAKSTCYMRLWELEGGDGADVGYAHEGGNADWEAEPSTDDEDDELEEENFADFAGDEPLVRFANDEDSDDEEPAPDQRRPGRDGPMQIELVNAAGHHIIHNIPERPRPAIPAAPVPPPAARPGRRRRGGPQHPPNHRAPPNQGRPPPAPANIRRLLALLPNLPNAPGPGFQQNNPRVVDGRVMRGPLGPGAGDDADEDDADADADAPRMVQVAAAPGQGNAVAQGLERFLQLAHNDQEDEWDSDELDDDLEIEPRARMRQNGRR
jgi:E3 ubiquitin-protein ligase RNF14